MSGIGAARAWAAARRDGITARFPSICRKCPEPINPGDRIAPPSWAAGSPTWTAYERTTNDSPRIPQR